MTLDPNLGVALALKYTGGIVKPRSDQALYRVRVNAAGDNLVYERVEAEAFDLIYEDTIIGNVAPHTGACETDGNETVTLLDIPIPKGGCTVDLRVFGKEGSGTYYVWHGEYVLFQNADGGTPTVLDYTTASAYASGVDGSHVHAAAFGMLRISADGSGTDGVVQWRAHAIMVRLGADV
jgi:hypothetical protein